MNNFWTLVGFEYKKIINRKSFIIATLITIFMLTFCMIANIFMSSRYENGNFVTAHDYEKTERELQHNVAGYINSQMITDVISKNVEVRDKADENGVYEDSIYNSNIRSYNSLRSHLARILSPIQAFDFENFNRLNSAEGIDFYELRTKLLEDKLTLANLAPKEIEQILKLNANLNNPFYMDYHSGYSNFLTMMSILSVFILLALCICIAPVFADEFQKKTDAIILSSKYGKSKLITAKIFTSITFSLSFTVAALAIALITTFSIYGIAGGDVSFQVWELLSVYPLTMAKALLIYCLIIICVSLLISAVCLVLSANFSTLTTITTLMMLLIGGMFFSIPLESLRTLNYLLPAKMIDSTFIFSERLVSVFGMYLKPYLLIPILCFLIIVILLPLSYKCFKNHQVE